jgi:hypothetical protein
MEEVITDVIHNEFNSLRRHVLDVLITIDTMYGTSDVEELEIMMPKDKWELYCLLNSIEGKLCI